MSDHKDLSTSTVRQVEQIPASPNDVFNALIDAKTHALFTGDVATSDPRVGGNMTAFDGYIDGKYLELERPSRIVQTWHTASWPDDYEDSRLEFQFEPVDGGTRLTMIHSLLPPDLADGFASGWKEHYWEPLKAHFKESR